MFMIDGAKRKKAFNFFGRRKEVEKMNLLESIKSKYGVVNIYNLIALIDEMISNKIKERNFEVEQDNKKYYSLYTTKLYHYNQFLYYP